MELGDLGWQRRSQQKKLPIKMTLQRTLKSHTSRDANAAPPNHSSLHKEEKFADVGVCASTGVPIRLCYQTFGDRSSARGVVLLIMGLASPSLFWDGHFCKALAARGLYVIRFDNRDIGRSTFLTGYKVVAVSSSVGGGGGGGSKGRSSTSSSSSSAMTVGAHHDVVDEWEPNLSLQAPPSPSPSPFRSWFRNLSRLSSSYAQLAYASVMQGRCQFFRDIYTLGDMANDCVGLLNALHIPQAHIVGMCMGGMIAQVMAIEHPTRVASLSLLSTHSSSPHTRWPALPDVLAIASGAHSAAQMGFDAPQEEEEDEQEKHQSSQERRNSLQGRRQRDVEKLTQILVSLFVRFAGGVHSRYPVDVEACKRQLRRVLRRSSDLSGLLRQYVTLLNAPSREAALQRVYIPTVVLHGTVDPLVPYQNGKQLAELIPHAKLVTFEGLGHILHPALREELVAAIVGNLQQVKSEPVGVKNLSRL